MEKSEILSLMNKYIMSIEFSEKDQATTIMNLLSTKQISPLSLNAKIEKECIVFFGKVFVENKISITFSSLGKVNVSAYSRILPTKGAGFSFPTNTYFICLTLETKKGLKLSFESRDYEKLKIFLKQCKAYDIPINDFSTDLSSLILTKDGKEIDAVLNKNWESLAEEHNLKSLRNDYRNEIGFKHDKYDEKI
ncbi:hypothetical protein DWZ83_04745 [Amedibacillus dolichus]|uniref:Uncharacterized protein n=1 Tax=Amedibacillus dolichus TaxID=31971 RepID=A0A415PHL1_9FIRM|nr:hypothetical protein [Amedibacillus dolichus]RHM12251.1 hypothetical protein DWZ83_04745 [Amedibacillus dolichus]